jgi:tetratricopeptide (TPR) repeat protein
MGQSPAPSGDSALTLRQRGNFAGALAATDQALQQNPHDCRMLTIRRLALKKLGKMNEASQSFEAATEACPKYLPGQEGLAELQYAQHSPKTEDESPNDEHQPPRFSLRRR